MFHNVVEHVHKYKQTTCVRLKSYFCGLGDYVGQRMRMDSQTTHGAMIKDNRQAANR